MNFSTINFQKTNLKNLKKKKIKEIIQIKRMSYR